jgi:hypothetical protein
MNTLWLSNIEILMEARRDDFRREMANLRLEREALSTRTHHPNWIEQKFHEFSLWMIATGERLNRRYIDPNPVPRWYQSFTVAK